MKGSLLVAIILSLALVSSYVAQETCKRHSEPKGGFSYCPPTGWSLEERPGINFKVAMGPRSDVFTPSLIAKELDVPASLNDVVSIMVKHYSDNPKAMGTEYVKVLNQSEFITSSKLQGIKLIFQSGKNGLDIRTTQYFFGTKGNTKLILAFTSLEKEGEVLDRIFDESMKTLQIGE
jgi:hypothetical protein